MVVRCFDFCFHDYVESAGEKPGDAHERPPAGVDVKFA